MSTGPLSNIIPDACPLPLDPRDSRTLAAAHLLLTEVWSYGTDRRESSHDEDAGLIKRTRDTRAGTGAIYAMLDPVTGQMIAAANVIHQMTDGDGQNESYTYVSKIAVVPALRGRGLCRSMLECVDREAQRRGDVLMRLYAYIPAIFRACGFTSEDGDGGSSMVAPVSAVTGLDVV